MNIEKKCFVLLEIERTYITNTVMERMYCRIVGARMGPR